MTVRAGRLRDRLELMQLTQLKDEYGAVIDTKSKLGVYWCESNQLSSSKTDGTLRQSQSVVEFTTRYNRYIGSIDPSMFISFRGDEYEILSVLNPRLLNEFLVITAKRR